jgi:hypothetical protein
MLIRTEIPRRHDEAINADLGRSRMSRHRIAPILMASVVLFIAAGVALVRTTSAQGIRAPDDPFGDIDLNSLRKNGRGKDRIPDFTRPDALPAMPPASKVDDEARVPEGTDPIGALTRVSIFDRAKRVYVGKSDAGKVACYFREQGDSHLLDIGIAGDGAFIRLETPEPRDATPTPPVRVFAGKEVTRRSGDGEFATGEFSVLKSLDGPVAYHVPKRDTGGFTLIAGADAKAFLEMVAHARTQFVVVQSKASPKTTNVVAIYAFKPDAIPALLSCSEKHVGTTTEPWASYTNARFGTTADYPTALFSIRERAPENGDGQTFRSRDGRAQLSIYGQHNATADTPKGYLENFVDRRGASYQRVTKQFYAISGKRDGRIFYQRCNFSADPQGIIDCLNVTYPEEDEIALNPIVTRMSRTLRSGRGAEPRR